MAFTALRLARRSVYTCYCKGYSSRSHNPKLQVKELFEKTNNSDPEGTHDLQMKGKSIKPAVNVIYQEFISGLRHSKLTADKAISCLNTLRVLHLKGEIDTSTLVNDDHFTKICSSFEKGSLKLRHEQLVTGLKCLLELGLSPESKLIRSVENDILWRSRKMSLKSLCLCLDFHTHFQDTDQQIDVLKQLVSHISRRWFEVSQPIEVVKIIKNQKYFDEDLISKVEDRALEFADKMTPDETISLLSVMSQQKRRPKPLLRALSYYLVQKNEKLSLRQCCDMSFILSSLHFPDVNVLNKITMDVLANLKDNTNGALVSSLMTTLSKLKWDHAVLLEQCCQWLESNISQCRDKDVAGIVISLAYLNYLPENSGTLFPLVLKVLKLPPSLGSELPPNTCLNVVWALAVLGQATPQQLLAVLNPNLIKSLTDMEGYKTVRNKIKLQNIAAVIKVEFPMIVQPPISVLTDFEIPTSEAEKKVTLSVIEGLQNFLPPPKFLASNLNTGLGFFIDAEFILDAKGDPVSILDHGVKAGNHKKLKPMPASFKRIALLVWNFKDLSLKTSSISGENALTVRLLTKLGYTVLEVPYIEYQNLHNTVKQVQYLQQKIKDCLLLSTK